ncbi:hemerythrin domain-containing protein [Actinokineospora sp. HUAS TT18]|uniref:hemerythrin domain-containing protein n=1 Tax=Actinokineospora sp. HUAS TT18 TaxID=3447451 RepID=UPI003F51C46C
MTTDVLDLILADHRRFEDLFRDLRDRTNDRGKLLDELSTRLVAHAEAEEAEVYPALRRFKDITDEEVEHGAEEHAEGNEELLALLEIEDTESDAWEEQLGELVKAVAHHLDEEERTILSDARETVPEARRAELGAAFVEARDARIEAGCGELDYVRDLVARTKK